MLKFGGLEGRDNWSKNSNFFEHIVKLSFAAYEKQMLRWSGVQVVLGGQGVEEEYKLGKIKEGKGQGKPSD